MTQDTTNSNDIDNSINAQEGNFAFQRIIGVLVFYWPWFIATLVLTMLIAFLYLRYSTAQYKVSATVLMQDDTKGGQMQDAFLLSELGLGNKSNVDNEAKIFQSRSLMEKVVNDLQLYVQYFTKGRIKTVERFNDKSFQLFFVPLFLDSVPRESKYTFKKLEGTAYELTQKDRKWQGHWGDTILLPIGRAVLTPTYSPYADEQEDYTITVNNPEIIVAKYMKDLLVTIPNKQVSTIDLTFETSLPAQGEAIVNRLISQYVESNVEDKNRIADSTMRFVDGRIAIVSQELTGIEKDIQGFKEATGLTDLSAQSQALIVNTSDYVKQLSQQQIELSIVESLEKYLRNQTEGIVPSSLIVQDPIFVGLITNYNLLQMEREKLLMSSTVNNPIVQNLDKRLANVKNDLFNSLASLKRGIQLSISQLSQQTGSLQKEMRSVPAKERVFIEKSRQQSIKQELYLFLLKKREETAITKAATLANSRIIDPAKSATLPYAPNRMLVYLSAVFLGIFLPSIILYLKETMNRRIVSKSDITSRTGTGILAEIGHNDNVAAIAVTESSRSVIAEQFRVLRTNLQFLLTNKDQKTILITSSMSGEGKSFIAMNVAASLALSGKKVVLMELDLRKPKISAQLKLANTIGFSNYAVEHADTQQIIFPSGIRENLWFIPSGPIPPNPAELILLNRTAELFATLKEQFDYIVIDTAPVGLVTDAQLLAQYADAALYIVRQKYTFKHEILKIQELYKQKKFSKLSLVVNDVQASEGYGGYGYGQGYGYGYGYGYGANGDGYFDEKKKKKKIFR